MRSYRNTKIELIVNEKPISGLIVTDRGSHVLLNVDKKLLLDDVRTKGNVERKKEIPKFK